MFKDILGNKIYIKDDIDIDSYPYKKELELEIEEYLLRKHSFKYVRPVPQQVGKALSTVDAPNEMKDLKHFMQFSETLKPYLQEAAIGISPEFEGRFLRLGRLWINVMYEGCYGLTHIHTSNECSVVGILYLEAPKNSSNLVIVNNNIQGLSDSEIEEKDKAFITPQPNMLVVHKHDINHAVTVHKSKHRRVCVIFEIYPGNLIT